MKEMQLLVQDASELLMGVTLILAAIILVQYTRQRTADLPPEERGAGQPLYLSALGILTLAVASFLNYQLELDATATIWTGTYYVSTMVAAAIFAIAALLILEWNRAIIVPIVMLALGTVYTYAIVILELAVSFGMVVGPISLILNLVPIGLFAYLARKTGRVTAIALLFLLVSYIIYPLASTSTDPSIIAALLGIRLLGPALAMWAFLRPELGVSIELFGYALSINVVAFFFSYVVSIGFTNLAITISVSLLAVLAVVGFATTTYTFTRYRERRNPATGLLAIYFVVGSVSYIIVALTSLGALTGDLNDYTSSILGILAMMFVNLSAFFALDWRRILLLPIVIAAPALSYMILSYPTPVDNIVGYGPMFGITNMIQNIVPLGLYFLLWHRMRKANAFGRSRPLFIGIGLVLLAIGSVIGAVTEGAMTAVGIVPSSTLLTAYIVFWLGVTGRADQLLGTVRPEV
ncbi:MAG: hypothetical protein ACXAAR_06275 [Candidatus Thorarchaeota archaeon]